MSENVDIPRLSRQLINAKDIETIQSLLRQGADPNYLHSRLEREALGETVFGWAIREQPVQQLQALLDGGANLHLANGIRNAISRDEGDTQWREVAEFLLEKGADIDAGMHQYHPNPQFHSGIQKGSLRKIGNALWQATYFGYPERVQFLLDHGAKTSIRSNRGGGFRTPLETARWNLAESIYRDESAAEGGWTNTMTDTQACRECVRILEEAEKGSEEADKSGEGADKTPKRRSKTPKTQQKVSKRQRTLPKRARNAPKRYPE